MKLFIKNVLRFGLFCGAAYLVYLLAWGEMVPRWLHRNLNCRRVFPGHLFSRIQEARRHAAVDVLVVGSSHAYRGFDPRIFSQRGYALFNLGSSSQTPMHSYVLLRRYIERFRPRLVIWEVYPVTFAIDGVESTLDLIANDNPDRFSFQWVLRHRHLTVFNDYIFSLYRRFARLDRGRTEDRVIGTDHYIPGGYVESRIRRNPEASPQGPAQAPTVLIDSHFDALSKGIGFLSAHGIPVVLVQAPITSQLRGAFTNEAEFDRRMAQDAPYLNFNGLAGLDDRLHYLDADHLNQDGVRLFNGVLIDRLQAEGWLPPASSSTDQAGSRREDENPRAE